MVDPDNSTRPLLRSPDFPWNCADLTDLAAVSLGDPALSESARAKILASIRVAKVGGDCWGIRADHSFPIVEAGQHASPDGVRVSKTKIAMTGETIIVEDESGPIATERPIDPWSVIDRNTRVFAAPQHEWAVIARMIDSEVVGVDSALLDDQIDRCLFNGLAYRDCFTGRPAAIEHIIGILAEWRRVQDRTRPIAVMTGIARWKREALERMLWLGRSTFPPSVATAAEAVALAEAKGGGIAVWPSRTPEGLAEQAAAAGIPLLAVEDGFIRSIGLGAGLHPPSSIIVDGRGLSTRTVDPRGGSARDDRPLRDQQICRRSRCPRPAPHHRQEDRACSWSGRGRSVRRDRRRRGRRKFRSAQTDPRARTRRLYPLQAAPRRGCRLPRRQGRRRC